MGTFYINSESTFFFCYCLQLPSSLITKVKCLKYIYVLSVASNININLVCAITEDMNVESCHNLGVGCVIVCSAEVTDFVHTLWYYIKNHIVILKNKIYIVEVQ